jgi:hypothetical protein
MASHGVKSSSSHVAAAVLTLGFVAFVSLAFAGLVPGGGNAKSDCYLGLDVEGSDAAEVTKGKLVVCEDGSACDTDSEDNQCTFKIALCPRPALLSTDGCESPDSLDDIRAQPVRVRGLGKLDVPVPNATSSVCGAMLDVPVALKVRGTRVKPGRVTVKAKAKAPRGTRPRNDPDKWILQCVGSPSGAFLG